MMQAIELVPAYAPAWFVLGEQRELRGDRSGAIAAFEQARIADPDDRHGAALRLQRLGGGSGRARTEGYLRALFDGYAPQFDHALTSGLNYRAPELPCPD
jgi:predicted TPR repeat methyltransferase